MQKTWTWARSTRPCNQQNWSCCYSAELNNRTTSLEHLCIISIFNHPNIEWANPITTICLLLLCRITRHNKYVPGSTMHHLQHNIEKLNCHLQHNIRLIEDWLTALAFSLHSTFDILLNKNHYGGVWFVFLNNISTHFFTHTYFHKCFQTTIFSF